MNSEEFLAAVRKAEGLKRAVLKKIEVEGTNVTFHLVTDLTYTEADIAAARAAASGCVPAGFSAQVKVVKSVPSAEGVKRAVLDFLRTRYPAVAAFVSPDDVEVELDGYGGRFFVGADEAERAMLQSDSALDALAAELNRNFCGGWMGELNFRKKEKGEIVSAPLPPEERVLAPRTFPVTKFEPIDGAEVKRAVYIADLEKEMQGVTACGVVSYIEERLTKNNKPYFSITVSDGTGSLRCAYFSKKATLEKVRAVKAGDSICLTGDNELWGGSLSFRAKQLDYGAPPEDFVPEARPSRPVPPQYRAVFPSPASDLVQGDLFAASRLPEALTKKNFVVFDLETTGLGESGVMDRIIEVGAVKIVGGQIREKFSTFVACPVRLSATIVELTGITDEMLVGAPEIKDVIADFYKFCDGCSLVGHNVQFDCKFIRYYGEKEGYLFDHRAYDTLSLAQEMLRLSNYKLNTVADHFGFTFNHHRAYDDAFVTAKIFLELVKMKGALPL